MYQTKITAVWLRKTKPKTGGNFFASDDPENHTRKGKKKWKQRGERKKEKKKNNGCTLSFYVEFFEDRIWNKKTVW